jgi:hypothetical protein
MYINALFRSLVCVLLCAISLSPASVAQNLSDSSRISLMTVAPGDFLYSTFGHSALRVFDPVNNIDRCYNYGTFDFDQPNFYLNFCRGKLLYSLDVEPGRHFVRGNLQDNRPMQEQVFDLGAAQRQRLFNLLETNALPENRSYKYDFFYDNCATRIRDIVQETFFHQLQVDSSKMSQDVTLRHLLHQYLAGSPWTQFGIDLVLGLPADRRATLKARTFLPDYLHDYLQTAKLPDGKPLVRSQRQIPNGGYPLRKEADSWLSVPLLATFLFALIGFFSMRSARWGRIFDMFFWFLLGLAGLIIALLWFATDHQATKNNLNIFWALPTHLLFFRSRRLGEWSDNYFTGVSLLALLLLLTWPFCPQQLPIPALPLVVLVVVKGYFRWRGRDGVDATGA